MKEVQRTTLNILFFIKKKKLLKTGEAPIFMRITINKCAIEMRVKRNVIVNYWSQDKECMTGKDKIANEVNSYLNTVRLNIYQIHRELEMSGHATSVRAIVDRYYGKDQKTVLSIFKEHNEKCQALVGKEYVAGTIRKFNTSLLYLKEYIQEQYKDDDMLLQEIDQEFVRNYEFFLKVDKNCQNNSALKHIKNFRKIIRIAIGNEWIRKDPFYGLHFKEEEVNIDFLTNEELDMLRKKEFSIQRLEQVRDIFVFCCFTGLAFVDVYQLTAEYLIKDNQGMLWIRKSRQKTKEMCNIPVLSAAKDILDKYEEHAISNEGGFLLPVLSNQKMNAYLKEIADVCNIKKRLTTHVARHTAATVVFLANDVSMENVAKILGHANTNMTRHYAKVLDQSIIKDMVNVEKCFS